ncbi:hypothetical protein [uncultured Propionibacterium sp.]|uniref:hypothetical protein n=1 Tax=uncultured Propionibacterium sp. TaxID=218066 RepID=UPI00292D93DB|nr:hypothetical protein [uncultured Propionibacterium sp.]
MRHLPIPRPGTVRAAGIAELAAGSLLSLMGAQQRTAVIAVLAVALLACGAATLATARRSPAEPEGAGGAPVHLDRSTGPDEAEDDRRCEIDAGQVPTLEALMTWIEQNRYLPWTPEGHWILRHRGQRAARIDCPPGSFSVRLLLPAAHGIAPRSHWSIAYERR